MKSRKEYLRRENLKAVRAEVTNQMLPKTG
jgi:hypothetical protein